MPMSGRVATAGVVARGGVFAAPLVRLGPDPREHSRPRLAAEPGQRRVARIPTCRRRLGKCRRRVFRPAGVVMTLGANGVDTGGGETVQVAIPFPGAKPPPRPISVLSGMSKPDPLSRSSPFTIRAQVAPMSPFAFRRVDECRGFSIRSHAFHRNDGAVLTHSVSLSRERTGSRPAAFSSFASA
jgi:hypothetical protein